MCTTVYITRPGTNDIEINSLGELRDSLGVAPVILPGYPVLPESSCLCPCDIDATAKLAGYSVRGDSWDALILTANA